VRYFAILFLCLAVMPARAQDTTPLRQATKDALFKQVIYEDTDTHMTVTLTGTDTLAVQVGDSKFTGKYTIEGKQMHAVTAGSGEQEHFDFDIIEDGVLRQMGGRAVLATATAGEKFKAIVAETKALSNARQIALACHLYASDNDGNFPPKLDDLVPVYLQDRGLFISPLSAKKEAMGYDYFGFGGTDSGNPKHLLLRSRDTTPDGLRVIVYFDCSGELKEDK
jgi:hypothetical protein